MKLIPVDLVGRGDRIKLLVTPSLGAQEGAPPVDDKFKLNGDLTVFVNDVRVCGKFEHDFAPSAQIYGVALWRGNLSDVKLVEY